MNPPKRALRIDGERGSLAYWQITPNVYATVVAGHMTEDMSRLIIAHGEALYESGNTVYGFHDWLDMAGYDSVCRVDLTAWVLRHRARSALSIGVLSRLVAMGVTVANLALGNLIQVYNDRPALDAALAETLSRVSG